MPARSILFLLWSHLARLVIGEMPKPRELNLIGQLEKPASAPYNEETELQLDLACNTPSGANSFMEGRRQPRIAQENKIIPPSHIGRMAEVLAQGYGRAQPNQRYAVLPFIPPQDDLRLENFDESANGASLVTQPQLSLSRMSKLPAYRNDDVWIHDSKDYPLFCQGSKRSTEYFDTNGSPTKQSRTQANSVKTCQFQGTEEGTLGAGSTSTTDAKCPARAQCAPFRRNALEPGRPQKHDTRVFLGAMYDYYLFRGVHVGRRSKETSYQRTKAVYLASNFMGNIELSKLGFSGARRKIWVEFEAIWSDAGQANCSGHPVAIPTREMKTRLAAVEHATKTALYSVHIINGLYEPAFFESQEELHEKQFEAFEALNQFWKQLDFDELEAQKKRLPYLHRISEMEVNTPSISINPSEEASHLQYTPDYTTMKDVQGDVRSTSQDEESRATESIINNSSNSWAKAIFYSRIATSHLLRTVFPEIACTLLDPSGLSKHFKTFLDDKVISQASVFGPGVIPSGSQVVFRTEFKIPRF